MRCVSTRSNSGKGRKTTKSREKKSYENECPFSVDWHSKVPAEPKDQILTVASQLPVASLLPSLFHATDVTTLECPLRVDTH